MASDAEAEAAAGAAAVAAAVETVEGQADASSSSGGSADGDGLDAVLARLANCFAPEGATAAEGATTLLVLGSDVTYSMGAHAPLCWTLRELLQRGSTRGGKGAATDGAAAPAAEADGWWPPVRAVLGHEHRTATAEMPDERLVHLRAAAADEGLRLKTLRSEVEGGRRVSMLEAQLRTPP